MTYDYFSHFPTKLRELMDETHTTIERLAEGIGVSMTTIHGWKNGKVAPRITDVEKIAKFFDVEIEYLIVDRQVKFEEVMG